MPGIYYNGGAQITVLTERLAKPFLKWAGGKGQLLTEIERRLPKGLKTGEIDTYVEPFVGGGAVFFHLAQRYENIKRFYLFDINNDLVNCYKAVKKDVGLLVRELLSLQDKFLELNSPKRKEFYLDIRKEFNLEKLSGFGIKTAAKLIFLNKNCYNGLYRVNRKGEFNVPFGDYKSPRICAAKNLQNASGILQIAKIIYADFTHSERYIDNHTFVYLDPPYRPLSPTASFTSYSKEDFDEAKQIRLAQFCRQIHGKGAKFLLSNSDPKNEDLEDHFFENQYGCFKIERVKANRAINCKASGRGQINELLITNY
ncbi:MAG TPA: DNA adenine methylase [Sedimentisphaerales bacterium]|nr:DNA adenine methylase [Sedimentisphaerales bacterium]